MTKKEFYKKDLAIFLDIFLETGDDKKIFDYLTFNSNLPSPRGNLELATAFVEMIETYSPKSFERLWDLCIKVTNISSDKAPVNDPKEFLTFCGTYSIGALGCANPKFLDKSLFRLKEMAYDSRWRTREAVAMGIQKLLEKQPEKTLKILDRWIENSNWLAMRAVAAGVAEPPILRNEWIARKALELHKKIFTTILNSTERKSIEFKTMKQGLAYTFSVVICALPKEEGIGYMYQLINSQDTEVLWIIRQNLRKNRLIKNFPDEVASLKELV